MTKADRRPELMALKMGSGWVVQALSHTHDSAWLETQEPQSYAMVLATMLGMVADGEYVLLEPTQ